MGSLDSAGRVSSLCWYFGACQFGRPKLFIIRFDPGPLVSTVLVFNVPCPNTTSENDEPNLSWEAF